MVPPALFRSGSAPGANVLLEDPPSLTLPVNRPAQAAGVLPAPPKPKQSAKPAARTEAAPKIEWRNATSIGLWWSGSLIDGTQLPVEGPDWVTWNPVTDSVPNAPSGGCTETSARSARSSPSSRRIAPPTRRRRAWSSATSASRVAGRWTRTCPTRTGSTSTSTTRGSTAPCESRACRTRSIAGSRRTSSTASSRLERPWCSSDTRPTSGSRERRHPVPEAREPHARPLPATRRIGRRRTTRDASR